jgi:hypothetical protein
VTAKIADEIPIAAGGPRRSAEVNDTGVFVFAAVILLAGLATAVAGSVAPFHRPTQRR